MCGRIRLSSDWSEIKIKLNFGAAAPAPNFEANYNLPPTGPTLVAWLSADGKRTPEIMRWGLLPRWSKDEKLSYTTFNARADTIDSKPAFREAWNKGQRCLIVTDGFYEWKRGASGKPKDKQAYAIGMADGGLMVMAGLYDEWVSPQGERVRSCTVITTEANEVIATLHDRMPVVLIEDQWPRWLNEVLTTPAGAKEMLKPCASELLKVWPVDNKVGNVRNGGADLAKAIAL